MWRKFFVAAVSSFSLLLLLWIAIAGVVWQFNNPLGNPLTFWTHFGPAMGFEKVAALQLPLGSK